MRNLLYRVLSSVILLPVVIFAFVRGGLVFVSLLALVSFCATYEISQIIAPKKINALLLSFCFSAALFIPVVLGLALAIQVIAIIFVLFLLNLVVLFDPAIEHGDLEKMGAIFLWVAYLNLSILCLFALRNLDPTDSLGMGFAFLVLVCLATWGNDSFAYFGGRIFGKRPMFARVSSKKTWEGFFCGAICSVLAIFLCRALSIALGFDIFVGLTSGDLLWISLPTCVLAPLGDLFESRLKRIYDVKDSGKILPGHGGILDRIDALLLVLPWAYAYAFIIR